MTLCSNQTRYPSKLLTVTSPRKIVQHDFPRRKGWITEYDVIAINTSRNPNLSLECFILDNHITIEASCNRLDYLLDLEIIPV